MSWATVSETDALQVLCKNFSWSCKMSDVWDKWNDVDVEMMNLYLKSTDMEKNAKLNHSIRHKSLVLCLKHLLLFLLHMWS